MVSLLIRCRFEFSIFMSQTRQFNLYVHIVLIMCQRVRMCNYIKADKKVFYILLSLWSLTNSFGLCSSHGEMHWAEETGFKECGKWRWERVRGGVWGVCGEEASWINHPIPALSETGVSVSQEQFGVRLGLDHAELLGVSHVRGYAGQKKAEKRRECRKD